MSDKPAINIEGAPFEDYRLPFGRNITDPHLQRGYANVIAFISHQILLRK